ncbi:MAG: hypothetical protein Q7O66_14355 [Dehalococcoidia bacterium]|nr:hypothetical protein [Dehalococcoidia bacterium]
MKNRLLIVAGAGLAVILISGALIGVALAADPTPNSTPGPGQVFITKLAKILGIQEQQLTDAVKMAQTAMIDESVQAGKLTPEQGNAQKDRLNKGNGLGAPMMGGRGGHAGPLGPGRPEGPGIERGLAPMPGHDITGVAALLGMTPADLTTALKTGRTLAQIGQEHGQAREPLKAAIIASIQKSVDQAVADGKLTKDKADTMMKNAKTQVDKMLDESFKAPNGPPKGLPQRNPNKT